ncbi:MAG: 3'(2'),5'-bisphosphate nucleotidase CysQ [Bacteroidales bacterium]|nr:3'(2'),5'-bisphosphate nucleotidase CysQ [Bacteroidales bacterium]MCF8390818.1 3'(2'),5'-bisphosphate nucleotidase CysQ [Bacteroidales bacterium]
MEIKSFIFPIQAAIKAGEEIKRIYEASDFEVSYKKDASPLTTADLAANKIIQGYLEKTDFPVLSEENKEITYAERKHWERFWMVDPLDGTKEFINKNGEFTVNIALISNQMPVFGVIYAPILNKLYFGAKDLGSFCMNVEQTCMIDEQILAKSTRLPNFKNENPKLLKVVASRSHLDTGTMEYIESLKSRDIEIEFVSKGSSLKLCLIAEGSADIYPRLGPTMEWDVAAGHAIIKYSGKTLIDFHSKEELKYNKENLLNHWFIAK